MCCNPAYIQSQSKQIINNDFMTSGEASKYYWIIQVQRRQHHNVGCGTVSDWNYVTTIIIIIIIIIINCVSFASNTSPLKGPKEIHLLVVVV